MKKIINYSFENEISKFIQENRNNLKLFFILFIINILIYGQKLFFYNLAGDDYYRFYLDHSTLYLIGQSGRWGQVLLNTYIFPDQLHILPYIHGLLGVFSFTLMGFLTAKYFKLNRSIDISIITLLISVNPMFAQNILFTTNITAWITLAFGIIGFLLAHKRQLLFKFLGLLLLVFAIGTYQTIIQIIFVMIGLKAIINLINAHKLDDIKSIVVDTIFFTLFSMFSLFIAIKINKLFLFIYKINESSRIGNISSDFDMNILFKIYTELPQFDYFSIPLNYMYTILTILFFLAIVYYTFTVRKEIKVKLISFFLIIVSIVALPIVINVPLIVQEYIPLRAYLPIAWVIAGFYVVQIMIFKGLFKTLSITIALMITIINIYYINVYFDAANRQVKSDLNRANMMVERIRTHENYTKEPLKLNIYGIKDFSVIGWKHPIQQPFYYLFGKYQIIKYFTDFKFKKIPYSAIEDVIDYLVEQGEEVSSYPEKNSVVVYKDKAVVFLDARYANKRINTAKLRKKIPDINGTHEFYLQDNILFYKKNFCTKKENMDFNLQLYPDSEDIEVRNSLETLPIMKWNFRFHDFGVKKDTTCISARVLPEYKLRKIDIEQYDNKGKVIWKGILDFERDIRSTNLCTKVELVNPKHDIRYSIGKFSEDNNTILISGWAFAEQSKTHNVRKYIVATKKDQQFFVKSLPTYREDVAVSFNDKQLITSGFETKIFKEDFPKGKYKLNILLIENKSGNQHFIKTNKSFFVK